MSKHEEFAPFDGDGRVKVYPPPVRFMQTGRPTAVTNSVARNLIDMFGRIGMSSHSPMVSTLWVLITWCKHHNKPFEVWRWDSEGSQYSSYGIFLDKISPDVSQEGATRVLTLEDLDGQ